MSDQAGADADGDTCDGSASGAGSVGSASSSSTDTSDSLPIWPDWHSGDGVGRAVLNSRYCAQIAPEEKLFGGGQLSSEGARVRRADPSASALETFL